MSSLPPELWLVIFALAVHTPGVLETEWPYPPDELIWQGYWASEDIGAESLRARRTIVCVSREWRDLGREFLYEDLVLRHREKVTTLVMLFEQSNSESLTPREGGDALSTGYGRWVKRVSLNDTSLLREDNFPDLERLFQQCSNVQTILINSRIGDSSCPAQIYRLFRYSRSLRRISVDNIKVKRERCRIFDHSNPALGLTRVTLPSDWMSRIFPSTDDSLTPTSLSNLSVLEVIIFNDIASLPAWDLPALRYLSISRLSDAHIPMTFPFFAVNGHRLLGLSVCTAQRCPSLHKLLERTPSIRNLVFDDLDLDTLRPPGSPSYPSITHIGIASTSYDQLADTERIQQGLDYILTEKLFPSLLTVRILADESTPSLGPEWDRPISIAAQYGIRLEDCRRRLLRRDEGHPTV